MNIFINISHPAHVHFFKYVIKKLQNKGHNVKIGNRDKEFTNQLLEYYNLSYITLSKKGNGAFGLLRELIHQQFGINDLIKENKFDLMLQIGGIFNAPIGRIRKIPTIAISDTENDKIGNKIGFGLSKYVLSPDCWNTEFGGHWKKQIKYPGYHELAYLSPKYYKSNIKPKNKFLLRFVGWGAGHDIGEKYLSDQQKIHLVHLLLNHGEVYISSENELPDELNKYAYSFHPAEIHDFLRDCKMIIGESATMASEASCLGIPAIFISNTGRGYTTEQDNKYNLIKHYNLQQWDNIISTITEWLSNDNLQEWQEKRYQMLKDKIEVTDWLVDLIEGFPESIEQARNGNFKQYYIN